MAEPQTRFSTVVAKAGKPSVHLTWLPIEKDPALKVALASNRVMTIHQVMRGGRKDYGTVGFIKAPQTQLFIFPKSLRKFTGQRIVAINYELLAEPPPTTKAGKDSPNLRRESLEAGMARIPKLPTPPKSRPTTPTPNPAPPRPLPAAKPAPVEPEIQLLTWADAIAALAKIKREMKGRLPGIGAELDALSERMKERLKPH